LFRYTENEKSLSVDTTDTISLKYKEQKRSDRNLEGYHDYHERSRVEFGLHLDSTEAHSSVRGHRKMTASL